MMKCIKCNTKLTSKHQKKFCSRSCAATHNNQIRSSKKNNCLCKQCLKSLRGRSGKSFCGHQCRALYITTKRFKEGKAGPRAIRTYLLKTRVHACEICNTQHWMNQPVPLEVDHIDGNHQNNHEENLRLICPNCHALTPTYKGRNYGNGRSRRLKRYHQGKSW